MLKSRERQVIALALLALSFLAGLDLVEDVRAGSPVLEVVHDGVSFFGIGFLLLYIWALQPATAWRRADQLARDARKQKQDLERLSQMTRKHLEGLSIYINAQFDEWELTPAEKDVALLLLKGLSIREVADLRTVSERTARQQATTIYAKADLPGRAALSAFFLEDLLIPAET